MKNRILTFALVIIVIAFISQSCKKDDVEMKSDNTYREFLSADDDPAEAKIISFINRMDLVREDPNYDNSENWNYSHDSAVWYIEASLNYKYAYPNEQRSKLLLDSMYITIDMNEEGDVNILELQNNFDLSLDTLTIKFESIDSESKFFVSIDYKLICNEDDVLQLIAYFYFGKFSVNLPDGDWKITGGQYGSGGICGTQTYLNFDATDKLEQELFNNNDVHLLDVFFTNILDHTYGVTLEGYGIVNSFSYSPANANVLYDEYYCSTGGCSPMNCLNLNYMDIYTGNIIPALNNYHQATNRSIFVEDVIWSFSMISIPMPHHHFHYLGGNTGIMHPRAVAQSPDFIQ